MMTYEAMAKMTDAEINKRIKWLTELLESPIDSEPWYEYHDEYCALNDILDERYRERNQVSFDAYYDKHIKGKRWEEIDPEHWQFYSDWHKDMYGYRPRFI